MRRKPKVTLRREARPYRIGDPPAVHREEAERIRERFERLRAAGAAMEDHFRHVSASIVEVA